MYQFYGILGTVTADIFPETSGSGRGQKGSFQIVLAFRNKIPGFFTDLYRNRRRLGEKYGFPQEIDFSSKTDQRKKAVNPEFLQLYMKPSTIRGRKGQRIFSAAFGAERQKQPFIFDFFSALIQKQEPQPDPG